MALTIATPMGRQFDFMIYSACDDHNWFSLGETRESVEAEYAKVLASGQFEQPRYRVIVKRKRA